MEQAIWTLVGLVALALVFQLYQWIEVASAKRDMMRAHADAYRATLLRATLSMKHGGNMDPLPSSVGSKRPPGKFPPPPPGFADWVNRTAQPQPARQPKKRRRR